MRQKSKDAIRRDFSVNLRKELSRRGLNMAEAARAAGVDVAVMWRWCNNLSAPDVASLYKLGRKLGISADKLLGLK